MDTETIKAISRLTEISEELLTIAKQLAADYMPVFPAEAAEKVKKRICLQRGEHVPLGKKYTRGLSQGAYTETNRLLKLGTLDERDLIEKGLLAPRDTPGRPKGKSALDGLLDKKDGGKVSESVATTVEEMKQATRKLTKRKTTKK